MGTADPLPYWNYNIPQDKHTVECPDFLLNPSDKDRSILATPDSDYHISTWSEVRQIALSNRLELFRRVPSELRRYKEFIHGLIRSHGSVGSFILDERLGWSTPVTPRDGPFENDDDHRILCSDWPYGIDPRIVHLNVWTKFELEEDPVTGDLTDEARRQTEKFVTDTFRSHVPDDQVCHGLRQIICCRGVGN